VVAVLGMFVWVLIEIEELRHYMAELLVHNRETMTTITKTRSRLESARIAANLSQQKIGGRV
jgi:hypothetical protein